MARRASAAMLVVLLGGGPLVAAVCALACASHQTGNMDHHSHHVPVLTDVAFGSLVSSGAHECAHPSVLGVAIFQSLQLLPTPASLTSDIFWLPRADQRGPAEVADAADLRPPGLLALVSQLRV